MIRFNIFNKEYSLSSNQIESVCLFGSTSRGDYDFRSDIDLLIVIDDCDEDIFVNIKKTFAETLEIPPDWISLYMRSTMEKMREYGSYFLWHLKLEGNILFSRTGFLEGLLSNLPSYDRVEDDLNDYLQISKDIEESLKSDIVILEYELAVLASLVRNTCIAFCFLYGKPRFGRVSPIKTTLEILGTNIFTITDYEQMYSFRLSRIRKEIKPSIAPSVEIVKIWLNRVNYLIQHCLERVRTNATNSDS